MSVFLLGCASYGVYTTVPSEVLDEKADNALMHEIFLIGDVGEDPGNSAAALQAMRKEALKGNQNENAIIFLGDNIYPEGMHAKDHPSRAQDEKRIDAQINAVKDFEGEIVFIPGNHDWKKGKEGGYKAVLRQEEYVQKALDAKVFRPSDACSGPNTVELSDEVILVFIDTQWWLHPHKKGKGEKDDCKYSTKEEYINAFKEILKKNRHKHIVVSGHHPLYSNGIHGGYFNWKDHLFPLRNLNKKWWLPLPLIGSIYPYYRSFLGNTQDIAHPNYQSMKRALMQAMSAYENVIFASGHEHNLQYQFHDRVHQIVSGSGSKITPLRKNVEMPFGTAKKGYAKLSIYNNGDVWLTYFEGVQEQAEGKVLFQKRLYNKKMKSFGQAVTKTPKSYKGKFKTVIPDSTFAASPIKKVFFGELNRKLWTTAIEVPYLDIHYAFGGLTPVSKGGGMQTLSLKMRGGDGRDYKLRAIKKSASNLVDPELRGTMAEDVIYDGIAASHPYAAVTLPVFSEAAEVYYTDPQLVYVPKDSILGDYIDDFGGQFCLIEVHPNDDMREYDNFGNSKAIVNYTKAIKKLEKHPDHKVDVEFAVRSRLLDMFLGDWDRHDDQWRWATFEEGEKTLYRPIPRDRDQVFFQFDGVVMSIANRKWLVRKFQHFKEDVRDIAGLNFNARYFDRYFLIEADAKIWQEQAAFLQNRLTDETIEKALKSLPKQAYEVNGDKLINLLKSRRTKLKEFAARHYKDLAKNVDVYGSMKDDYFDVQRQNDGSVRVSIYPRKEGKKVEEERYYYRQFLPSETKEIRLYGLDGKDEYVIEGEVKRSIKLRVIASEDKDKIKDKSSVKGWTKQTIYYDQFGKDEIETHQETKVILKKEEEVYLFNRKDFVNDKLTPIPEIGFNVNDGFYIGPGFSFKKQGFKKKPYHSLHRLKMHYAFGVDGFAIDYENRFREVLGQLDLQNNVFIHQPEVYDFFGQGNETSPSRSQLQSSNVEINRYEVGSKLIHTSKNLATQYSLNLNYQVLDLETFPVDPLKPLRFSNEDFGSIGVGFQYLNTDDRVHPSKGLGFITSAEYMRSFQNEEVSFSRLRAELSLYIPLEITQKQTVLALRSGIAGNLGDYNFYQANFLNGLEHFRGVPRNRFAGRTSSYSNAELRQSLIKVKNYVMPFDLGVVVHSDFGRVWISGENSSKWHNSFGGGMFISILDYLAIVGTYSISDVDRQFILATNFYF